MLQALVKTLFHHTGLYLGRSPRHHGKANFSIDGLHYGLSFPAANYAPWRGDDGFQRIYHRIEGNTLVDVYRCYELWQLVEKVHILDPHAAILEVGVWRGGTAGTMAAQLSAQKSEATLYLADTFSGVAKAGAHDSFYAGGEHSDTNQQIVEHILNNVVQYANYRILRGVFPEDTAHEIKPGERIGLCHIDVDVYASARDVLEWVWDRLIAGGVVVFDDCGFHNCVGVTRLVEEYRNRADRQTIYNLNGHAIMIKLAPRDRS